MMRPKILSMFVIMIGVLNFKKFTNSAKTKNGPLLSDKLKITLPN